MIRGLVITKHVRRGWVAQITSHFFIGYLGCFPTLISRR